MPILRDQDLHYFPCKYSLLHFEVHKLSEFSIKTWNTMKYIKSDIQNIDALKTYDPII